MTRYIRYQRSIRIYSLHVQLLNEIGHRRMHNNLHSITIVLILSSSFIMLSYFVSSADSSLAANTTSSLLSSLTKQAPLKKMASLPNVTKPSPNGTRLQQIPSNIEFNVEKIKNIVNTTASDVRNSIKKTISDVRTALLDLGIRIAEIGSIIAAAIAMIALIRRPWLRIDKTQPPFVRRIEVGAYGIDDTSLPFDLRTFKISYKINTVLVRNKGWKVAKNCKGILNIGNEEVKLYWYASAAFERDVMTINTHSAEYLELFAIVDGEPSEIFSMLSENISKLKDYVNSETVTDVSLRQTLNMRIAAIVNKYRSAEDIPRIIVQDANEGWRIPGDKYQHSIREPDIWRSIMINGNIPLEKTKDIAKVTVTLENARRLQERITILDKSDGVRGTAIRF